LGVHALDAPGIPLLISVKTLTALKAILDFEHARICFKDAAPDVWIPLKRSPNGHLLLDLTQDWVPMSPGVGNCMIAAPMRRNPMRSTSVRQLQQLIMLEQFQVKKVFFKVITFLLHQQFHQWQSFNMFHMACMKSLTMQRCLMRWRCHAPQECNQLENMNMLAMLSNLLETQAQTCG
jgi:hypothetical protein